DHLPSIEIHREDGQPLLIPTRPPSLLHHLFSSFFISPQSSPSTTSSPRTNLRDCHIDALLLPHSRPLPQP
ncbi:hypothetical protein PENTCL1PPCAC_24826, partial [Pristionchus entomophagus]